MYRGLWVYPKVGKKPVCGAKLFTAYRHTERGGGENLRPFCCAVVSLGADGTGNGVAQTPKKTQRPLVGFVLIVPTQGKRHDQAHGNETATGCSTESNPAHGRSTFSEHNSHQRGKSHQGEDPSSGLQVHNESLPRVCMCGCAPPTGNAPGTVCVPSQHTLK